MKSYPLNPEQQLAVKLLGKDIVVAASAGTGKTTVLVERIIKRIVADQISIQQIVAITFTNAAAAEMKNRLTTRLVDYQQDYPSDFLKQQLLLINTADISTIHAFCLKLIKNYYYMIDLEPQHAHNLLDDLLTAKLQKQAFKNIYQKHVLANPLAYQTLTNALTLNPLNYATLESTVLALAQTASLHISPSDWLTSFLADFKNVTSFSNLKTTTKKAWFGYLSFKIQNLLFLLSQLKANMQAENKLNPAENDIFILLNNKFNQILNTLAKEDYETYLAQLASLNEIEIKSLRDSAKTQDTYRKIFKEMIENLWTEDELSNDLNAQYLVMEQLVFLTTAYLQEFTQLKQAEQGLDFDDLERLAYQILMAHDQEIAKYLKNYYQEILVDEFQDTSYLQNEIIKLISNGKNSFRVGDLKQAIYRFRGGKPDIMMDLIKNAQPATTELIYLKHNYRSANNIIAFNNETFQQLMTLPFYNNYYTSEDNVQAGSPTQSKFNVPVKLCFFNYAKDEYPGTKNSLLAQHFAELIYELTTKDHYNYRDIVILTRSHTQKKYLKDVFDGLNIPSYILLKDGFATSESILTIKACLRLLINPADEIALVATLVNLFGVTNDDLANWKIKYPTKLYAALLAEKHPALLKIEALREMNFYQLTEILNAIYQINDYYQSKCDQAQRANLDVLSSKAAVFQKEATHLTEFYELLETLEVKDISEGSTISESDNVIRVMTIHQAKGLEFPVVLFWGNSALKSHNSFIPITTNDKLGYGLVTVLKNTIFKRFNLKQELIEFNNTLEDIAEEIRLLYVALTRAKERLLIVGADSKLPEATNLTSFDIYNSNNYLAWLSNTGQQVSSAYYQTQIKTQLLPKEELVLKAGTPTNELVGEFTPLPPVAEVSSSVRPSASGLDLSGGDNFAALAKGTRIHEILAKLPANNWSEALIKNYNPKITTDEIELLLRLYQHPFYQAVLNAEMEKEVPFIFKDTSARIINGYIDLIIWKKPINYIVDFKTDQVKQAETLITRYQSQLSYYYQALSAIYPEQQFEAYIYSFALNEFILVKLSQSLNNL